MGSRFIRPGIALIAIAVLLFALYGPGFVGYDGAYALDWGRALAHGDSPNLETPSSPTPHPLVNAVSPIAAPPIPPQKTALEVTPSYLRSLLDSNADRPRPVPPRLHCQRPTTSAANGVARAPTTIASGCGVGASSRSKSGLRAWAMSPPQTSDQYAS